jgi:hypothetical protein
VRLVSKRGEWQRHYLINRRADWVHQSHADASLGAPAKVAAYVLALSLNEKTLAAQVGLMHLAATAGVSTRRMQEALAQLEKAGRLSINLRAYKVNEYVAILRDDIRTKPSEDAGDDVRTETSAQVNRHIRTKPSEDAGAVTADVTANVTSSMCGRFPSDMRTFSAPCTDAFDTMYGRNRPTEQYNNSSELAGGAASGREPSGDKQGANGTGRALRSAPSQSSPASSSPASTSGLEASVSPAGDGDDYEAPTEAPDGPGEADDWWHDLDDEHQMEAVDDDDIPF